MGHKGEGADKHNDKYTNTLLRIFGSNANTNTEKLKWKQKLHSNNRIERQICDCKKGIRFNCTASSGNDSTQRTRFIGSESDPIQVFMFVQDSIFKK